MNQLDILAQNRNALLLAEAIGWLHDYRKCSDEQLKTQAANLSKEQGLPHSEAKAPNSLSSKHSLLVNVILQLTIVQSSARSVTNLLHDDTWKNDLLGQFLCRCHGTAHFDKQDLAKDYGKQDYPGVQISSPFGFESDIPSGLTNKLWDLPWNALGSYTAQQRESFRAAVSNLFSQAVADTRRPINEVDLWNWGLLVGALYKAALAGVLLTGNTPTDRDLRWRLLSIRVDGLKYLLNAARIPDLLARRDLLSSSLDNVRDLLEVTYPLGSEVYRDEDGSVYVVPDVAGLLERTDAQGISLRMLIEQAFEQGAVKDNAALRLGGEVTPHIELEQTPWWGQDPGWPSSSNDKLPNIAGFLSRKVTSPPKADQIRQSWQGEAADICTVCGLRPEGPSQKAIDRNVCDICEQRRADRSKQWAVSETEKTETIWTDEVADANGRLALIVGRFDLTHWLDGSLLESLLLVGPHDPQNTTGKDPVSKTPSFSRLRRIWETTRRFWKKTQDDIFQELTDARRRLKVYFDPNLNLGLYHVYDLMIGPTDLSVVWVPPQGDEEGFLISADNPGYISHQLGAKTAVFSSPAASAIFIEDHLREHFVENSQQLTLHNPDAQGSQNDITVRRIDYQETEYATAIPILVEPRTFMMIVPADKSLKLLRKIKKKYECEMGKVRDRLPLHLGIVYASRRTPVRAILEAGRSMLEYPTSQQVWTVKPKPDGDAGNVAVLELERNGHQITWRVPLKMGDGSTDDRWYPYFLLETDGDDSKADEANRRAVKITWPAQSNQEEKRWVVHAADLRDGENICCWPSTFDFEFLDTTARRFEIHYGTDGRRPGRRTRPFYLEDLGRLKELWRYMEKGLTKTQRHQVVRTIEATRETWYGQDENGKSTTDGVFEQFVRDTLAGATWKDGYAWSKIPEDWQDKLVRAGVGGELTDLAELHMEILKE